MLSLMITLEVSMEKENKHIKCDVKDCEYNNCECEHCTLDEIKVCSCAKEEEKEATMCDSYKCRDEKKENDDE